MNKKVDRYNSLYEFKGKTDDIDFSKYISSIDIMNGIRDGDISLTISVLNQNNLSKEKAKINMRNPRHKSKK